MPTIGEQLKQARESRRLSIQQVVQGTRIRSYYLEAMEADDFSRMPSAAQARGFLRSYAEFVGLSADALIDSQRSEAALPEELNAPPPADLELQQAKAEAQIQPEEPPAPAAPEPAPEEVETPQTETPAAREEPTTPAVSQLIFFEIGHELRQRRELLSLTLEEIERHTRV